MTTLLLRLFEHGHGHLGWLAVAALIHPAILLRKPRRAHLATLSGTTLVTVAWLLGAWIYPSYRRTLKQFIFIEAPRVGWMFERKEHLAVGVLAFAWIGLITYNLWRRGGDDRLHRVAHLSYVFAAAMAFVTAVIGVAVAVTRTF